jgi:hypothetical protein
METKTEAHKTLDVDPCGAVADTTVGQDPTLLVVVFATGVLLGALAVTVLRDVRSVLR